MWKKPSPNPNLKNQKSPTIVQAIKTIKYVYVQRGFIVTVMNMDDEFEHLQEEISLISIYLNIVSRNENISEIERSKRMIKEKSTHSRTDTFLRDFQDKWL